MDEELKTALAAIDSRLDILDQQFLGLSEKIGRIDADTAAAIIKNNGDIAAMQGTVSDLAASVSRIGSAKGGETAAAAPVVPGGGDPAGVADGSTMNWNGGSR